MPAANLLEYAKLGRSPQEKGVINMFASSLTFFNYITFETISGGAVKFNRTSSIPTVAFRGINETYTPSVGAVTPMVEQLFIFGGEVNCDRKLVQWHGPGYLDLYVQTQIQNLAHTFAQKFIKGDTSTEPREWDGLQIRASGAQLIDAKTTPTSGGDAISVEKMHEAWLAVEGGPTAILTTRRMITILTMGALDVNVGGYVTSQLNQFGRRVDFWNGVPLVPMDELGHAHVPLAFDEVGGGGGSAVTTSMYFCRFGDGMLTAIQDGPPLIDNFQALETAPLSKFRVDWGVGLAAYHGRSFVRLRGIKDAAMTKVPA